MNEKLAAAYEELIATVCDIVIKSDGVINNAEVELAEKIKALCV
ncbi:MAG: hypothetical protein ACI396_05630 [Acutalibacteraceae bacterium]